MLRRVVLLCGALLVGVMLLGGVALAAVITCPGGKCRGTNKADQITGTIGVDQIYALGGDDSVQGGEGADLMTPVRRGSRRPRRGGELTALGEGDKEGHY